jgi:hypothetical protein
MLLAMDVGMWGLIFGIAALVLAIPMAIVANIFTPLLLDWLAKWSTASLERRIAQNETELAKLEADCPLITPTEEQLMNGVLCIVKVTLWGFEMLGLALLFIATGGAGLPLSYGFRLFIGCVGGGSILLVWIWQRTMIKRFTKYRTTHSPRYRHQLRKSLMNLKGSRHKELTGQD